MDSQQPPQLASPKSANFFIPDGVLYLKDYGYGYFDSAGNWVYWYPDDLDFGLDGTQGAEMSGDAGARGGEDSLALQNNPNNDDSGEFLNGLTQAQEQQRGAQDDWLQTAHTNAQEQSFEQLVNVDQPQQPGAEHVDEFEQLAEQYQEQQQQGYQQDYQQHYEHNQYDQQYHFDSNYPAQQPHHTHEEQYGAAQQPYEVAQQQYEPLQQQYQVDPYQPQLSEPSQPLQQVPHTKQAEQPQTYNSQYAPQQQYLPPQEQSGHGESDNYASLYSAAYAPPAQYAPPAIDQMMYAQPAEAQQAQQSVYSPPAQPAQVQDVYATPQAAVHPPPPPPPAAQAQDQTSTYSVPEQPPAAQSVHSPPPPVKAQVQRSAYDPPTSNEQVYEQAPQQPVYDQLSQQSVYDQTAQQSVYDQPAQQSVYDQPSQQSLYDQPAQQSVYDQPVQQSVYDQPPQQSVYDQPAQQSVYDQPAQPAQQSVYDQPQQSVYDQPSSQQSFYTPQQQQSVYSPQQQTKQAVYSPPAQQSVYAPPSAQAASKSASPAPQQAARSSDTYSKAPIVSFGFGGKVVIHNPSSAHYASPFTPLTPSTLGMPQNTSSTVNICDLTGLLPADLSSRFPGPLFGNTHTKKADVVQYLESKMNMGAGQARVALLKVIRLLVVHNGVLSSNQSEEIRDALLSEEVTTSSNPLTSHKRAPSGLQITVPADDTSPHIKPFPSSQTPYAVEESMVATYSVTTGHLDTIQDLLVKGDKRDAVQYALEHKLWSHALIISSCVDKQLWSETVGAVANYELSGGQDTGKNWDSLRVAYSLFAGAQNTSIAPSDTSHWNMTASTLVDNLNNVDAQRALAELGDKLLEKGELDAAHTCYILSPAVGYGSKMHLIGCAKGVYDGEACQLAEVVEYALSLSPHFKKGEYQGLPYLQAYKVVRAWELTECGKLSDSNRYCEAIATVIKLSKQPPYHPNLYLQLKELSDRLSTHSSADDKSWLTKKIARPSLDTLWNSMEGRLTKFIAGNDDDVKTPMAEKKEVEDDPFATFTSIDESSTNGRLSRAVSAFDLPNYGNGGGDRRASDSPSYLNPGNALGQPRAASAMGGLGGATGISNMQSLLRDLPSPMEGEVGGANGEEEVTPVAVTPPFSGGLSGEAGASQPPPPPPPASTQPPPPPPAAGLSGASPRPPASSPAQPPPPPPPAAGLTSPFGYAPGNAEDGGDAEEEDEQDNVTSNAPAPPQNPLQPPPPPPSALTSPFGHTSAAASEDFNAPEEMDESEGGNFVSLMDSMDVPMTNANTYSSPRVIDEIDEEEEEDDLGFGNNSTKMAKDKRAKEKGEQGGAAASAQSQPPPPPPAPSAQEKTGWFSRSTTPANTPKMDEKEEDREEKKQEKRPELKQSASSSWLSRWWKKDEQQAGPGPVKAKLGEQSSFYYDPEQKRWVNKANESSGTGSSPKMPPPPPRANTTSPGVAGGGMRGGSTLKNSVSMDLRGMSASMGGGSGMPPPPPRPPSAAPPSRPASATPNAQSQAQSQPHPPAPSPAMPTPNSAQPPPPPGQRKGKKAARNKYVAVNI